MKTFDVTLSHFIIRDGCAQAHPGTTRVGRVNALELMQILMFFQDISPIQHFDGEPVVNITTKMGGRYVVRTDLHRLMLYDTRRLDASALVLEAASILVEIDDSLKKSKANLTERLNRSGQEPLDSSVWWKSPLVLCSGSFALFIGLAFWTWSLQPSSPDVVLDYDLVTRKMEQASLQQMASGAYATGRLPGDYIIQVLSNGELGLMQIGEHPPQFIRLPYQMAKSKEKLFIVAPDLQLIQVERDQLRMGDLVFKRY